MPEENEDHDNLVTLVADVRNLKEGQERFHLEMRNSIRDIKDNYTGKLNDHETRLNFLENFRTKQTVLLSIGTGLLTLLTSLLIYHILH